MPSRSFMGTPCHVCARPLPQVGSVVRHASAVGCHFRLARRRGLRPGYPRGRAKLVTRDRRPTFGHACGLLGILKQDPSRERRGSLFLEPFDRRFSYISLNPDIDDRDSDLPLEHIGLTGPPFSLGLRDVFHRFPRHKLKLNTYDGGYQIFFHPVPRRYEFTTLGASTDLVDIADPRDLIVNNVTFYFGDALAEYRDGFAMRR